MRHSFELGCGRLGFGVLALVCMASAAPAQTVNPPTVPLEFVQMFSTITPFPTMGTPEIVVEGLPEVRKEWGMAESRELAALLAVVRG